MLPYKLAALFEKLAIFGCGPVRRAGEEWRCRCPAHDDNGPSLFIALTQAAILVRCSAGCSVEDVCAKLDHTVAGLFFDPSEPWVDDPADGNEAMRVVMNISLGTALALRDQFDLRHAVYSQVLAKLELSSAHFDALCRRGLPPQEIIRRAYRTADVMKIRKVVDELLRQYDRDRLVTVPGFSLKSDRVTMSIPAGLIIPVRRIGGDVIALKVRHDVGSTGPKFSWVSSRDASCGNPVHVPLGVPSTSAVVRLTEGELKADIATVLSGIPTISAPGIANWRVAIPTLKELGARKVFLAMDRDGKPGTLAATEQALFGLTREGFEVQLETWDGSVGKGIDDRLAAGGKTEIVTGLAAAVRLRDEHSTPKVECTGDKNPEPEPAPFPIDVLPPKLADFCRQVAEATATPPDFAGMAMLVTAGAAIGNGRALELKAGSWSEGPRIYAGAVGDPASGKTPAIELVVSPFQMLQNLELGEYAEARRAYTEAGVDAERVAAQNRGVPAADRVPPPLPPDEPPPPQRLIVSDATVESLAPILEANPRGLLLVADEGVGWVRGMDRYRGGKGNDRQFWLSTWSGKTHLVDRKSQGTVPICIPRPFVNVLFGVQPDMLNELADRQGRQDGFLHRILFVLPKGSPAGEWCEDSIDEDVAGNWMKTLAHLRTLELVQYPDLMLGPRIIRFSTESKEIWATWWDEHAAEMRSPELPARLLGPWGKLRSYCARFTLLLHLLAVVQDDGPAEGRVQPRIVEAAVQLVNYFKAHTRLVYSRLQQAPADDHIDEVVDWIRDHDGRCTARELLRAKKVKNSDDAKKLMKELEARGFGRLESRDAANNKRVTVFIFDPS